MLRKSEDEKLLDFWISTHLNYKLPKFREPEERRGGAICMYARDFHIKLVTILLENGVAPDTPLDSDGRTALHWSVLQRCMGTVEVLLKHKANVNLGTREKITPLHVAASWGYIELVSKLLEHGALIDTTEENKNTALHVALFYKDVAEVLIKNGANLFLKNNDGKTAEQLCDLPPSLKALFEEQKPKWHYLANILKFKHTNTELGQLSTCFTQEQRRLIASQSLDDIRNAHPNEGELSRGKLLYTLILNCPDEAALTILAKKEGARAAVKLYIDSLAEEEETSLLAESKDKTTKLGKFFVFHRHLIPSKFPGLFGEPKHLSTIKKESLRSDSSHSSEMQPLVKKPGSETKGEVDDYEGDGSSSRATSSAPQ